MRNFKFLAICGIAASLIFASCKKDEDNSNEAVTYQSNKEKGEQFLLNNRSAAGVKETSSGLQYKVVAYNKDAQRPNPNDTVKVYMKGNALGGETFADTIYTIILPQQVKGLQEGIRLMTVGSEFEFYVPYYLGFGSETKKLYYKYNTISVLPYSSLYYKVRLIQIGAR